MDGRLIRFDIQEYLIRMLKEVLKFDKVFMCPTNPRIEDEAPCVCVHYGQEDYDVKGGNMLHPLIQGSALPVFFDVIRPGLVKDLDDTELRRQLEKDVASIRQGMGDDNTLGRLLDTWDPEEGDGLIAGSNLTAIAPYTAVQNTTAIRVVYMLHRHVDAVPDKKQEDFCEFGGTLEPSDSEDTIEFNKELECQEVN